MVELLVRIVDKISEDPVQDAQLTKRGDVIAWHKEGQDWGILERTSPQWRIIKADISEEQAESLCSPEYPQDLIKEYTMLRKRGIKLDLDSIGIDTIEVRTRNDSKIPIMRKADIDNIISVKERLAESDIIGEVDNIIGPK